jgi:CHAT domain-containing protein/tetratricopeptide (TPR) repeat protein
MHKWLCLVALGLASVATPAPAQEPPRDGPAAPTLSAEEQAELARAQELDRRALELCSQEKYAAALPLAEEALAVRERVLGREDCDTASSLDHVARLLRGMGDCATARPLMERALVIREKALGPEHRDTVVSLNNLANLLRDMGEYDTARPLFERALVNSQKAFGSESPETAASFHDLAVLLRDMGAYTAARPLFERALAIREKAFGPEHPRTAATLNSLAALFQNMGDYAAARPLFERSLAIREKALGPEDPRTAAGLNNLALLLDEMGDYATARPLFERALTISEGAFGPAHPQTATCLNNLARLLTGMGDYAAARALFERSLAIREKALGPEHPHTAATLNNLALLLQEMGDFAAARLLLERALAIRDKALGPEHPETAQSLDNLAGVLDDMGDKSAARPLLERSLAIREKALGPEHPDTAQGLENLALLLHAMGDDATARPLFERAVTVWEKALGAEHPDTALGLNNLAVVFQAMGDCTAARPLLERALAIREKVVRATFATTSQRQRLALLGANRGALDNYLTSFAGDEPRRLSAVLRWKGIVGRVLAGERAALRAQATPAVRAKLDDLRLLQARLAKAYFAPFEAETKTGTATRRETIEQLTKEKEAIEVDLARESAAFREEQSLAAAGLDHVRAALPADAALVEVLQFGGRYGAWVVPGGTTVTAFVDLGPVNEIDAKILDYRRVIARREPAMAEGQALAKLVFAPIRPHLAGRTTIYFAPDGALAAVPLAALPDGDGTFLVERYTIGYLTSGIDLARARRTTSAPGRGLLAVGGIDYEAAAETPTASAIAVEATAPLPATAGALLVSRTAPRPAGGRLAFPALPATGPEARTVTALFRARFRGEPATLLAGGAATEAAWKRLAPGCRYLHLATHGFFASDDVRSALGSRGSATIALGKASAPDLAADRPVAGFNPLLLSGVALAGANAGASGEGEDGILTAEEVSGLALDGVELVVLSACDTGLGEVHRGEGVLGLARGFTLAGARTLVLSLWKVPDQDTLALMTRLYGELWGDAPPPKPEALRRAQLLLLERARKDGDAAPWRWGGFVAAGAP